jgi:hypothetical protein
MKKIFRCLANSIAEISLLLAIHNCGWAQQPAPPDVPPATTPAVNTPDPERLKKHVEYLASPDLAGRKPGTAGARKAAAYVADEFFRLRLGCGVSGLKCLHSESRRNGYWKEFPLIAAADLGDNNALGTRTGDKRALLSLREHWMPHGDSPTATGLGGPILFAGHGVTALESKHDDYAGIDAREKFVLAFAGAPDPALQRFSEVREKAAAAKAHGAKALLLIAREEQFPNDPLSNLQFDQLAGLAALPVAVLSRQIAADWLGLAEVAQLAALEKTKSDWPEIADRLKGRTIGLSIQVARLAVPALNVIGVIEGNDPVLKREYMIVAAHYDHLGLGGPGNSKEIHPGADDNASGVAGLLELARILSLERSQLRRSVLLIAFSGEEAGMIGSNHYLSNPPFPLTDTIAMLNLDMIGRLREDRLFLSGAGTVPEFRGIVETANTGMLSLQWDDIGRSPGDEVPFCAKRIPTLSFFTGPHEDYHRPTDTAEKINLDGLAKVIRLTADVMRAIDRAPARPVFASPKTSAAAQ